MTDRRRWTGIHGVVVRKEKDHKGRKLSDLRDVWLGVKKGVSRRIRARRVSAINNIDLRMATGLPTPGSPPGLVNNRRFNATSICFSSFLLCP